MLPRIFHMSAFMRLLSVIVPVMLLTTVVHGQMRVSSWNVARLFGDESAIEDALVGIRNDDKPGFAIAPAIMMFQEVRSGDRATVEALVASAMPDVNYTRATYTSSGSEDGSGGAQLMLPTDLRTCQDMPACGMSAGPLSRRLL